MSNGKLIAVVDDDDDVRESLNWLLVAEGLEPRCFASGSEFLKDYEPEKYDCILLDVRMPGMNGLEVFNALRSFKYFPPVIFLSGHADICTAVDAVKNGASEFLQKPIETDLADQIETLIKSDSEKREKWRQVKSVESQLSNLTAREHEVMQLILAGKLNKQIADELGIAIKTVEVHRSRILEKMNVRSALALANLLNKVSN